MLVAAAFLALTAAPVAAQPAVEHRRDCNDPSDPEARITACTKLIQSGEYSGQNLAFVFNSRGLGYRRLGDSDRAIRDFDEAIRLSPSLAQAFNNRGLTYSDMGQSARAIQDFDQAIRLDRSRPAAFANRCKERTIIGQLEPALTDCQEALRLRPDEPTILLHRGVVHLMAGRLDAAIADFDATLRAVQDAHAFYGRGIARKRKGDNAGGDADIVAAKLIQPAIVDWMAKWGVR